MIKLKFSYDKFLIGTGYPDHALFLAEFDIKSQTFSTIKKIKDFKFEHFDFI